MLSLVAPVACFLSCCCSVSFASFLVPLLNFVIRILRLDGLVHCCCCWLDLFQPFAMCEAYSTSVSLKKGSVYYCVMYFGSTSLEVLVVAVVVVVVS